MFLTSALFLLLPLAYAEPTWCGKQYTISSPRTPPPPDSKFSYPPTSPHRLLDLKCQPASSIYLAGDEVWDPPAVLVDANLTWDVGSPFDSHRDDQLSVTVYIDNVLVVKGASVLAGSLGTLIPLPLSSLEPTLNPHTLTCKASSGSQVFQSESELWYLPPNPYGGSAVKIDRRSGSLWVKERPETDGWEKMIPFGWYDAIDVTETTSSPHPTIVDTIWDTAHWLLSSLGLSHWSPPPRKPSWPEQDPQLSNSERLHLSSSHRFNMIHPVPPGPSYSHSGDSSAIQAYFQEAHKLGLRIMYDMRHSFSSLSAISAQVKEFRNQTGLLVWYTADEPDGPGDPLSSTIDAKNLIRSLDPYHPVALVLNCQDYHFSSYSAGADILLTDVYSIALNPLYSKKWSTPITPDFGCSGCDACQGNFCDLSNRIDEWFDRLRLMGRARTPIWVVPQGFNDHGEEFWWRVPEGREVAVQIVLAFNHGAMGHCAWLAASSTADILSHLYVQTRFLIDSSHTRQHLLSSIPHDGENGIDISSWTHTYISGEEVEEILVLAVQVNYIGQNDFVEFTIPSLSNSVPRRNGHELQSHLRVKEVLFGDVRMNQGEVKFRMGRTSVAGVVLKRTKLKEDALKVGTTRGLRMFQAQGSRVEF